MTGALSIWSRSEGRRRLGTLIVLALLIALAGGATLAALAGARRADTAYERLREQTKAVDAAAFGSADLVDVAINDPRVAAVAPVWFAAVFAVDDPSLFPFVVPGRDTVGRTIERPVILEGRRADPSKVHEVVLPEAVARRAGKRVGDPMRFKSITQESLAIFEQEDFEPDGPDFTLRVVGISRSPSDLSVRDQDLHFTYLTKAWGDRYGGRIARLADGMLVRLEGGSSTFGAWSQDVNRGLQDESPVQPLFTAPAVEDSISVIVDGLRLFAMVAAIVGLVAGIQAIGRQAGGSARDLDVLRTLGVTRSARAGASVISVLPALVAGAVGALVIAYVCSPFMPIGLARRAEPAKGWSFDGLILVGGSLVILVLALAIAAAAGWRVSARAGAVAGSSSGGRVPRILFGLPPVALTGFLLATQRGKGRDAVPVRAAIVGTAVAIAGVVAVSMFASGLQRLIHEPARYGVPWDASVIEPDTNNQEPERAMARLAAVEAVDEIAKVHFQLAGLLDGQVEGEGLVIQPRRGALEAVMRTGRAPVADDEIALGADSARRLGVDIGGRVRLSGPQGARTMRVVGETLMPGVDDPPALASGFLVTRDAAAALDLFSGEDASTRYVVTFAPGVSTARGVGTLEAAGFEVATPAPPPEVARLRDVESLPLALAVLLAIIGSIVVVLALVITVRRRRRDLALLQVFGFTRAQLTGSVVCQAGVFAALGVVIGIPLGLLVGRLAWSRIAGELGVGTDAAIPVAGIVLTVVGVGVVALIAALAPAARAAHLQPAQILRQE